MAKSFFCPIKDPETQRAYDAFQAHLKERGLTMTGEFRKWVKARHANIEKVAQSGEVPA